METVLAKVTRNGQLTLPAVARHALGIEEGDYIEVSIDEDRLVLTPKKLIDKSQAYFWTPEWQAGEREASRDIAEGRVFRFKSADDLIADLHKQRSEQLPKDR